MAPGAAANPRAKPKGVHKAKNALHKRRREQRGLAKTSKKTAKNRARDVERRLRKLKANGGAAADVAESEKRLAALREEASGAADARKKVATEKRYAERYRKVKFFERQKVERRLKKLRKELAARPAADGPARVKALEDDLLYDGRAGTRRSFQKERPGSSAGTSRGAAAAGTWIFQGDESRPGRG